MLLLQVKVVRRSASDTRLPNPTNSLGYILAPGKGKRQLNSSPDHDLPRSLAEGFPVVPAIDRLDAESCCQEEELQFAREKDMHIESGEETFVFACLEKLFVCPGDVLLLLEEIIPARSIEQHGKFVTRSADLIFQVDVRRTVEGVAQVIDVGQEDIYNEASTCREMIVGVPEGVKLLLYFIKVRNGVKRQKNQVELAFVFELIVAHVAFVQGDALPHRFGLSLQLATIGGQHLGSDIQPLQLKVTGAVQ